MTDTLRVTAAALNVRAEPTTAARVVALARRGDEMALVTDSAWKHVRTASGVEGWVHGSYVEAVEEDEAGREAQNRTPEPAEQADPQLGGGANRTAPRPRWRLARSLERLFEQVNARAPHRSRAMDGTIGDRAHQQRESDHNPNAAGVVTAADITDDPRGGCDCLVLAELLRASRDPRIKYVIHAGRIFSSTVQAWRWRPYTGADPHTHHLHVSVTSDAERYDDASPWGIG